MRNPTEMMREILVNEIAQEMIDYVTPKYGESYVGLWLFQAIGKVIGKVYDIAVALRDETTPATATLLLDYWEDRYAILRNRNLSVQQRRDRIIAKIQSRAPANPARLAFAVSTALGGVPVDITENVAKNTFLVNIREAVPSITPAVAVLERIKPAHLIYQMQIVTQTVTDAEIKTAIAMTRAEYFKVEVQQ